MDIKKVRVRDYISYEEILENLELFRLEKKRLWEDLIVAFHYLKQGL